MPSRLSRIVPVPTACLPLLLCLLGNFAVAAPSLATRKACRSAGAPRPGDEVCGREQALLQRRGSLSVSSFSRLEARAADAAAHIRSLHSKPEGAAGSLKAGLEAVSAAIEEFTASPPAFEEGIQTMAVKLFETVSALIPPERFGHGSDFEDIHERWIETFMELPALVQSIDDDLRTFADSGDAEKLVRAVNTMLLEASTFVSQLLPVELGEEVSRFLGAVADAFDGIVDGIGVFSEGDAERALERVYIGVETAASDISPAAKTDAVARRARYLSLQQARAGAGVGGNLSDSDMKASQHDSDVKAAMGGSQGIIMGLLDSTIGGLSKKILGYKKLITESTACWKQFFGRERQRPKLCEEGYSWDGEQWCLHKATKAYTIQSIRNGLYLNVFEGSEDEGANAIVWNDPDSGNSQWRVRHMSDGNYTIQNVHGFSYLHAAAESANVQMSYDPSSPYSRWRLEPVFPDFSEYWIRNAGTGGYIHLEGGFLASGTNVDLLGHVAHSRWRIAAVWGKEPFRPEPGEQDDRQKAVLLEQSVAGKGRPSGALPARCLSESHEKRGAWCYEPCPSGNVATGTRCKSRCEGKFPADSPLLCAQSSGVLMQAIAKMVTGTIQQVITVGGLISGLIASGFVAAPALGLTIQALVDLGKPFAHPLCPK